ncbi:hypothetical protein ACF0H5_000989 [Mactra antiquata]
MTSDCCDDDENKDNNTDKTGVGCDDDEYKDNDNNRKLVLAVKMMNIKIRIIIETGVGCENDEYKDNDNIRKTGVDCNDDEYKDSDHNRGLFVMMMNIKIMIIIENWC